MLYFFIFIFGSVVGSFLNVCIWRLPRDESIFKPRSHCPNCQRPIPWYDNIPFLSFLFLKGRCRFCKGRISFRYFLVEFITASLFLIFFLRFGSDPKFFIYTLLCCGLIVATFVDFKHQIIPEQITLGGLGAGLILSAIFPQLHEVVSRWRSVLSSLLGALVGGGSIYLMGLLGKAIFKKEAMGGGDVKLLAMVGAFIGWRLTVLAFFLGPFFGSVVGIYLKLRKKVDIIPYGPYLSLASIVSILWGEQILRRLFF